MRFGLFGGPAGGGASPDVDAYGNYAGMVIEAEQLGFSGVYLLEHHLTGRDQISSTLAMFAYRAGRTSSIQLGAAVGVVPRHDPLLFAEQAATVDVLSGGRLDLGVGRGYRDYEFTGFGVEQDEAGSRFDEAIEALCLTWGSEERFSYHGRTWDFEDVVIEPRSVQQPHPSLWLGADSPFSIERAGREGYRLFLDQVGSFELTAKRVATYRSARESTGLSYVALGRRPRTSRSPARCGSRVAPRNASSSSSATSPR